MITPTRFGLKYAPVPTLALEYEDDLSSVDGEGPTSLYVLHEGEPRPRVKKLHVVELPMLTKASETSRILEQLQRDDSRFLSPSVVNERQLRRLLDLLVERFEAVGGASDATSPATVASVSTAVIHAKVADHDGVSEEDEQGEADNSFIEESMAEASQALEASNDPDPVLPPMNPPLAEKALNRGTFLSQEEDESETEQEAAASRSERERETSKTLVGGNGYDDEQFGNPDKATVAVAAVSQAPAATVDDTEKDQEEAGEEEKKSALRSESEVSEEDIQSEELEYFSEDGSDEDSF